MKDLLAFLNSPKAFALLVVAACVALVATKQVPLERCAEVAAILAGLFRTAQAIDAHAAAVAGQPAVFVPGSPDGGGDSGAPAQASLPPATKPSAELPATLN